MVLETIEEEVGVQLRNCRVVAGAIAKQILDNIKINAYTKSIGNVSLDDNYILDNHKNIEDSIVRCPEKTTSDKMIAEIKNAKNGDTLGGIVKCVIKVYPLV